MAAIHAGVIKSENGGSIEIVIANGVHKYMGSNQNGVASLNYGQSLRSFIIYQQSESKMNITKLTCKENALAQP